MKERTRFGNTLFMNSHIDIFNLAHGAIHAFVEELWEFRPDFLLVNPTYLQIFGSRAKALDLELPPVELVLSSYQYMSNLQRKVLSRLTNAPVYNNLHGHGAVRLPVGRRVLARQLACARGSLLP